MFLVSFQQVSGQKSEKHRLIVDYVTPESPADIADIKKVSLFVSCWLVILYTSLCVRKPTIWVPTRSDTNQAVQSQQMVRGWKFWIQKVEELYYQCSENTGVDQPCSYCTADLRFCFRL